MLYDGTRLHYAMCTTQRYDRLPLLVSVSEPCQVACFHITIKASNQLDEMQNLSSVLVCLRHKKDNTPRIVVYIHNWIASIEH